MHYSLHSDFMGACWYPRGALKVSGRFSMVSVVLDGYWSFSLVSFENCRCKWTCCVFDTCIENPLCTYFSAVILIHILNDCWIELLLITFIIWIIIELTPDHDFLTLTHCAHSFQVQSMPMWAFLCSRWEEEVSKRQQMESLVETLQEVRFQTYYIVTVLMFDIQMHWCLASCK